MRLQRKAFELSLALLLFEAGCSSDKITAPPKAAHPASVPHTDAQPFGAASPQQIQIQTYEGSGQTVHPSVVGFSQPGCAKYAFAITPYPAGNATFENPSAYCGSDELVWNTPTGLSNPVIGPYKSGYNSDPELVFDPSSAKLLLFFRQVGSSSNIIKAVSTGDLVHYSAQQTLLDVPNHDAVSPTATVAQDGHPAMLWVVKSGEAGCRTSVSKVVMRNLQNLSASNLSGIEVGDPVTTDLSQPGMVVWHIAIKYVPELKQYLAVYAAYPSSSSCGDDDLYMALSSDGVKWQTFSTPLLKRNIADWVSLSLYRASFVVEQGKFKLWFSGFKPPQVWSTGYIEGQLSDVLHGLGASNSVSASAQRNIPVFSKKQKQEDLRKPEPIWRDDFP